MEPPGSDGLPVDWSARRAKSRRSLGRRLALQFAHDRVGCLLRPFLCHHHSRLSGRQNMSVSPAGNPRAGSVARKNSSQFVGFQLAGQDYAFRIEQIQEIVILDKVTKTPQVPEYVEGVSN